MKLRHIYTLIQLGGSRLTNETLFYHRHLLLSSDWSAAFKTHAPIRLVPGMKADSWLTQTEILRNLKVVINKLIVQTAPTIHNQTRD